MGFLTYDLINKRFCDWLLGLKVLTFYIRRSIDETEHGHRVNGIKIAFPLTSMRLENWFRMRIVRGRQFTDSLEN